MNDRPDDGPIDADALTEPLIFCNISGGENGWFHCDIRTTAKTIGEAKALAGAFLAGIFSGKRKLVRTEAEAREERDLEYDRRVVSGYCRFAFRIDEDGPTELSARSDSVEYVGFAPRAPQP